MVRLSKAELLAEYNSVHSEFQVAIKRFCNFTYEHGDPATIKATGEFLVALNNFLAIRNLTENLLAEALLRSHNA